MSNELQNKMVEIITSIQDSVSKVNDFSVNQLSDVVRQYILFGTIQAWLFTVIFGLIFGFSVHFFIKSLNNGWSDRFGRFTKNGVLGVFSALSSLIFCFPTFVWLNNAILVTVAPKVWLIHELASIVK